MSAALTNEINTTFDQLTQVLSSIDDSNMDKVPFEGSWTAGQVTEHIIKSVINMPKVLNGPTENTDRDPDEKSAMLRSIFMDYSNKMKSPDFILPTEDHHDKNALLRSISDIKEQMAEGAALPDLTLTCTAFKLPNLGFLTRQELLTFAIAHTARHTQQLRNVAQALA